MVPSVSTISSVCGCRSAIQNSTSRWHHFDCAEPGEARKTKKRESASAVLIASERSWAAARLVPSRKALTARSFHHGLAKRCSAVCSAGASRPSALCE
jgi:hypothetical protein